MLLVSRQLRLRLSSWDLSDVRLGDSDPSSLPGLLTYIHPFPVPQFVRVMRRIGTNELGYFSIVWGILILSFRLVQGMQGKDSFSFVGYLVICLNFILLLG